MDTHELAFTEGFSGSPIGPIPVRHAVRRVLAFCSSRQSGFIGYDLAGHVARTTGRLSEVGPWSILVADALAGQVSVRNVDDFAAHVEEFARLLKAVPDEDLATLNDVGLTRVVEFCGFGFSGAWAPKITKAGAVFRPKTLPIMDGYLSLAFGYSQDGFSAGASRRERIERVVRALAAGIRQQREVLDGIRREVELVVPAATILTDVRLTDIIIWATQDDRMERPGKARDAWLNASPGDPPKLEDVRWISL